MKKNLTVARDTILTTHPHYKDFRSTLVNLPDIQVADGRSLRVMQEEKATSFLTIALDVLEKHFARWANASLLPAALLSDLPLASMVATVILGREPVLEFDQHYSWCHSKNFNLQEYFDFVKQYAPTVANGHASPYTALTRLMAERLLNEEADLRDTRSEDPVKLHFWASYLPLASNTQFVEAGVKEAKMVSTTDRSEQLRSAYAVNRAARVHTIGALADMSSTNRIQGLMASAKLHCEQQDALRITHGDYSTSIATVEEYMRKEHFKKERLEKKKQAAIDKGDTNKKANTLQQKGGVDRTNAMNGLIAYGKLVRRLHHDDLAVELQFRGCTVDEISTWSITERKAKLKALEIQRVDGADNKERAAKAFKPLSTAPFAAS